jgi:hypothetical protein
VLAHDRLDGLGGLIGMVEGDGTDVVVQNVRLDDTVKQMATDEAKLAIDGSSSATDKVPLLWGVMRQRGIGMLQVGDGNYITS